MEAEDGTVDYFDPGTGQTIQLSAKVAKKVEIKEFPVDENGQIVVGKALSAQSTNAYSSKAGVGLTVALTDRKAVLSRADGGKIDLIEPGKYEAHTLLSWTGDDTEEGWSYTEPTQDGSPGDTWAQLTGVASGSWSTKEYTQYNPPKIGDDIVVKWSGSSVGAKEYGPPVPGWANPVHVRTTTYDGKALYADWGGSSPKNETWKYSVQDRQDKGQVDLECKWFYHFAHENWRNEQPGNILRFTGDDLFSTPFLDNVRPTYTSLPIYDKSVTVHTIYEWAQGVSSGFTIHRNHIGISEIRTSYGKSSILWFSAPYGVTVSRKSNKDGYYRAYVVADAPSRKATIDIWNKLGSVSSTQAVFAPYDSFEVSYDWERIGGAD